MAKYLVESYDWQINYLGEHSDGALGQGGGSEKIYLHVLDIDDDTIKRLVPRVDDADNRQSDRLSRPNDDEWWIAVAGDKAYPKINPKLTSRCSMGQDGIPRPQALGDSQLASLRKAGARIA